MGVFILLVNDIIRVYDSHIKCFREFKCLCINLISEIITYYRVCMASCSWNGSCNSISDLCSEWILKVLNDYKLVQTLMLLFCFVLLWLCFLIFPRWICQIWRELHSLLEAADLSLSTVLTGNGWEQSQPMLSSDGL